MIVARPLAPTAAAKPAAPRRVSLPPSLPPAGDLMATPLPRLLFELYTATYSGVVRLTRKGIERSIVVWGGTPVHIAVEASAPDMLGQLLLSHGRITQAQLDKAVAQAPQRVGRALVEQGVLQDKDLLDALREQTERRIAATFAWRDGMYRIEPRTELPPDLVVCEVHPLTAIWRGVSEHYDLASLLSYFHPLRARHVVASQLFTVHYERLGPFLRNLDMAALLNGKTTVEAALRSNDQRALELAQALYVLLVTDMVRAQAQPGAAARLPETKAAPVATKPVDYRELTRACDEIARAYLEVKERPPAVVLGVAPGAPAAEVEAAFAARSAPFHPERLMPGLPDDIVRRARDVLEALQQARDLLIAGGAPPEPAAVELDLAAISLDADALPPSLELEAPSAAPPPAATERPGEALHREAQALLVELDYKGAQKKLEQAIAANGREPNYWVSLSQALQLDTSIPAEISRHGAMNCLRQAFGLDPTHPGANLEMARIFLQLGQKDQARTHLQAVLQQRPEHQEARRLLASL